jgi:hypothetical protein
MDDSERSYGYSEDIYHKPGRTEDEKSYEYGSEGGLEDNVELSPEEAAIHIEGRRRDEEQEPGPEAAAPYDHGRGTTYGEVESFTWGDADADSEKDAAGAREEETIGAEKKNR